MNPHPRPLAMTLGACLVAGLALLAGHIAPAGSLPADAGDKPPHCSLTTQAEVADLMGKPVQPGSETLMGCSWKPQGKNMSYFTVYVKRFKGSLQEQFRPSRASVKAVMIPDLGDEALAAVEQGGVLDLYVKKGPWLVRFNCPFLNIDQGTPKYAKLLALAAKAVSRLP